MFVTYGYTVQKLFEVDANLLINGTTSTGCFRPLLLMFSLHLPVLAIIVSITAVSGIFAAKAAINKLDLDWKRYGLGVTYPITHERCIAAMERQATFLPSLTGGGAAKARVRGFLFPIAIPALMLLTWLVVFASGNKVLWLALPFADELQSLRRR